MSRLGDQRFLGGKNMTVRRLYGRGVIAGRARGPALISDRTIMGWGGIEIHSGIVVEKGHPLEGISIKDSILILDGSKGSNGWSLFFHSAQVAGCGPAGLVFPRLDSRTAVTAAVLNIPLVTDVAPAIFQQIRVGDMVLIDGETGLIEFDRPAGDCPPMRTEEIL
jgi:hypothetical protein